MNMTFRKLVLFSALTVLLGVGVVYALSYEFEPSPLPPSKGVISVSAYYAVKQPDGSYEGSYVQVPVTVTGPESHDGTTVTDGNNPLNFTVTPGQYSVSGTYGNATPPAVTANVSAGSYVKIVLNFASSPPPSPPPAAEGVNDGLELTIALEKAEYSFGEPMNITLTLTNISNQTTSFDLSPSRKDFDFRVYNSTYSILYQWQDRWGALELPLEIGETLNPGESLSETLTWRQTTNVGDPVSPGTYYVIGRIGGCSIWNETSTSETTPIQVTIAAP